MRISSTSQFLFSHLKRFLCLLITKPHLGQSIKTRPIRRFRRVRLLDFLFQILASMPNYHFQANPYFRVRFLTIRARAFWFFEYQAQPATFNCLLAKFIPQHIIIEFDKNGDYIYSKCSNPTPPPIQSTEIVNISRNVMTRIHTVTPALNFR